MKPSWVRVGLNPKTADLAGERRGRPQGGHVKTRTESAVTPPQFEGHRGWLEPPGPGRRPGSDSPSEPPERTRTKVWTLISDFWPPDLRGDRCLRFEATVPGDGRAAQETGPLPPHPESDRWDAEERCPRRAQRHSFRPRAFFVPITNVLCLQQ